MSAAPNPEATDSSEHPAGLLDQDGAPLRYGVAVEELEEILRTLESATVDVDALTAQVARANELIRYCQDRLDAVRADVNDVLADSSADG